MRGEMEGDSAVLPASPSLFRACVSGEVDEKHIYIYSG